MKERIIYVDKEYWYEHMVDTPKYKIDILINRELIILSDKGITVYTNSFI